MSELLKLQLLAVFIIFVIQLIIALFKTAVEAHYTEEWRKEIKDDNLYYLHQGKYYNYETQEEMG